MKNKLLIFATFVLVSFGAIASTTTKNTTTLNPYYNNYGDSFTFVESGVTFAVFQNGEFDFYINPRRGVSFGYQGNGVNISFNSGYNYDAYVQYDNYGAIIQIENIPIYYDYYGRVTQIGNIDIDYNYGRLVRLGRLYVHYDRYGHYVNYSGYINRYNRHYVYHPYHDYFSRPLFDFRIVSYKPYRTHYKPIRHKYYRDHSRNKYYNKYNNRYSYKKRDTYNTRQRVATTNIPKRRSDNIAKVERKNTRTNDQVYRNKNTRNNSINRSTGKKTAKNYKRNNTATRSQTNRAYTVEKRSKANAPTKIDRRIKTDKTPKRVVERRNTVKQKQTGDKTVKTRKSVTVKNRKGTAVNKKRDAVKREQRSDNTRKRRG
ncbi:hypothetical protein [uncultured Lutibacter sp.]|uniref:hypothetical protein n=1 Tax=Lutibacter sp. TaxID=1925666 RepID=UPI0026258A62|nr:hypothetical protein [uncultured Lutibacter sp.]